MKTLVMLLEYAMKKRASRIMQDPVFRIVWTILIPTVMRLHIY